ncbi:glycoside hydrolase family 95 protein [Paenibacillus fonticola]|uniref:glycoside hydrolase family 95 protein n=1 Tax=Paenibacillus fonticola TaxID=379896 RepID=UPI00036093E1|nr:glycoside hydrolase family 95 protein [Paenibacillus fonticola]
MSDFKLWYSSPANNWSQGLPIGNGRVGAVIMSAPQREIWSVSEVTYWSGQAEHTPSRSEGKAGLERMRKHFFAGDYAGGDRLAKQYLQPEKQNYGTNLALCDVIITFDRLEEGAEQINQTTEAGHFSRELDLRDAIVQTNSRIDGNRLQREVFASHPDNIVACRLWSERAGAVSFTLELKGSTEQFAVEAASESSLLFQGQATEKIHSSGSCGVKSQGAVKVVTAGGTVRQEAGRLVISSADEAWIYFAVSTDYRSGTDAWAKEIERLLEKAIEYGYAGLRENHFKDYRQQYDKVSIRLETSEQSALPTDERIRLFKQGQIDDPQLFALFLQYGRYLTIAGSRADSPLPMNLQGIWNDGEACRMGWSCDYHLDINTQMNYYPTEVTNLGESHLPLMRYIEDLSKAGKVTANDFYGCEGWVAHVFSNAWGFTAPGWETSWGLNVTGGLWIATHLIEHYEYSQDRDFLERQAYPVLKEAAAFFLEYMTIHPGYGYLVTGPSNSPENHFYPHDRSQGVQQLSMGSTLDQVLVRDLFQFCLEAAKILNRDEPFQDTLQEAIAKLPPLKIGKRGQLQEWLEDYEEAQPEHRHLSHLTALYPGNQVTPDGTPELSAAARVTLENRMLQDELEDIEFTAALFGLYYARLHDGNKARKHIAHLIGELCFDNMLTYSKPGIAGAETNIFVIDGNFGGTAAIAEMLLQSHAGEIHLLPALPEAWSSGAVAGLRAKGNAEVDIAWKHGQLARATLRAFTPGVVTIRAGESKLSLDVESGGVYHLNGQLEVE